MTASLDMTRESFVHAVNRENVREQSLGIVIVRLLAVALMVTSRRTRMDHSQGLAVPKAYRAWPLISSEVESSGARQQLRFYVCPKGAITADDEGFPVGTAMVVETYDLSRSTGPLAGMPRQKGQGGGGSQPSHPGSGSEERRPPFLELVIVPFMCISINGACG